MKERKGTMTKRNIKHNRCLTVILKFSIIRQLQCCKCVNVPNCFLNCYIVLFHCYRCSVTWKIPYIPLPKVGFFTKEAQKANESISGRDPSSWWRE